MGSPCNQINLFQYITKSQGVNTTMFATEQLTDYQQLELEAAAFRQLLKHLDDNKQVQNIDLMNLAGFCRNCLAKWYTAAAEERGLEIGYEDARERVYGMPYTEWKAKYQTP